MRSLLARAPAAFAILALSACAPSPSQPPPASASPAPATSAPAPTPQVSSLVAIDSGEVGLGPEPVVRELEGGAIFVLGLAIGRIDLDARRVDWDPALAKGLPRSATSSFIPKDMFGRWPDAAFLIASSLDYPASIDGYGWLVPALYRRSQAHAGWQRVAWVGDFRSSMHVLPAGPGRWIGVRRGYGIAANTPLQAARLTWPGSVALREIPCPSEHAHHVVADAPAAHLLVACDLPPKLHDLSFEFDSATRAVELPPNVRPYAAAATGAREAVLAARVGDRHALLHYDGDSLHRVDLPLTAAATSLHADAGRVFLETDEQLYEIDITRPPLRAVPLAAPPFVTTPLQIAAARAGSLWLVSQDTLLRRDPDGTYQRWTLPRGLHFAHARADGSAWLVGSGIALARPHGDPSGARKLSE